MPEALFLCQSKKNYAELEIGMVEIYHKAVTPAANDKVFFSFASILAVVYKYIYAAHTHIYTGGRV